jgi:hypothetical protein
MAAGPLWVAGMRRVLILSCSQRKRPDPGLLPAIERYDGPPFRVLRRYLRQQPPDPPDTYVLSAEYGLIPAARLIPDYDRRMTPRRAEELRTDVGLALSGILNGPQVLASPDRELFVSVGKVYRRALDGQDGPTFSAVTVRSARSAQGVKLSRLHDWLYGESPAPITRARNPPDGQPLRLRGVAVAVTAEEAMIRVQRRLQRRGTAVPACHAWYVLVGDQPIPPKWMIHVLTGLPLRAFTTSEARSVLGRLGIEVQRG